jgi:hypothetical protein
MSWQPARSTNTYIYYGRQLQRISYGIPFYLEAGRSYMRRWMNKLLEPRARKLNAAENPLRMRRERQQYLQGPIRLQTHNQPTADTAGRNRNRNRNRKKCTWQQNTPHVHFNEAVRTHSTRPKTSTANTSNMFRHGARRRARVSRR